MKKLITVVCVLIFGVFLGMVCKQADKVPTARVYTLKNVPFEKSEEPSAIHLDADGCGSGDASSEQIGNRIFFWEEDNNCHYTLFSTEDGVHYEKTKMNADFYRRLGMSPERARDMNTSLGRIKKVGKTLYLFGSSAIDNKSYQNFMVNTTDGKTFSDYRTLPYESGTWFEIGNTKLLMGSIMDNGILKKDKKTGTFTEAYNFSISKDGTHWEKKSFVLHGKLDGKDHIYNDALRKTHCVTSLGGVTCDDTYLYFRVTFCEDDHKNYDDVEFPPTRYNETYVYRTKDFEHFEKVAIPGLAVDLNSYHWEELVKDEKDNLYGFTEEWKASDEECESGNLSGLSVSCGQPLTRIFKCRPNRILSARVAKGCSFYPNALTNSVTVFVGFESDSFNYHEKYPTSIFTISGDASEVREYRSRLFVEDFSDGFTDMVHGYQWIKNVDYQGYVTYLLFSKDGFATSYKVPLPKRTKAVAMNDDVLVTTGDAGHYYLSLDKLYKMMN